jgi:hypothetical protein
LIKQGTEAIEKLLNTTTQTEAKLDHCRQKISFFSKGIMGLILSSILIGSLLGSAVIHFSFPKMDQQMLHQLEMGAAFQTI